MSALLLMFDDGPSPAFSANFMSGALPAGLTYTNSSTTRTYFGSDGLLKTAVANEPIFETLGGVYQGMRWEMKQQTNLLIQSVFPGGGLAPTGWSGGGVGSGPASSSYGNSDSSQAWTQTATANRPFISQASSTLSADTTYTLSMLIESVSGTVLADNVLGVVGIPAGASTSYPVCSANPSGGASDITSGTLEVRVAIGATAGAVTVRAGLGVSGDATATLKFSRPQLEVGTSRSSFIPTEAAAVTRQPDVLTATSISPWFNASEGTVVFEGIASELAASGRAPVGFHNGTVQNRIALYLGASSANFRVLDANVEQANITIAGATAGSIFRHVGTYKASDFSASFNGASGTPDTSGTVPTITTLSLGVGTSSSGLPFMGYARRFQYFNTRLPGPTIQGLSRV